MLDRLSPDDVYALTKRRRHSAQFRVLNALGIPARPDGDGAPIVLRSAVEAVLGVPGDSRERAAEPDWEALERPNGADRRKPPDGRP